MSGKLFVLYMVLGLSVAMAKKGPKNYEIRIGESTLLGSSHLAPGDYKIHLEGAKAVFLNEASGQKVETTVDAHTTARKFDDTEITCTKSNDGNVHLTEIRLNGTHLQLEFPN